MKRSSKAAEAPAPPPASTPKTSAKGWATNPISQMYARITVGRRRETGDWSHSESEEKVAEARAEDVPAGPVRVHVYDLVEDDYREALTGSGFTVGGSVIAVNDGTYHLGWGAFHAGVEVGGLEYSFGSCPKGTGVYAVEPTRAPGYKFRETLEMGETPLSRREARTLMLEMRASGRRELQRAAAQLLHVRRRGCARLGVKPVPAWVNHLANSPRPSRRRARREPRRGAAQRVRAALRGAGRRRRRRLRPRRRAVQREARAVLPARRRRGGLRGRGRPSSTLDPALPRGRIRRATAANAAPVRYSGSVT